MLRIIFEVPDNEAPLGILRDAREAIARAYPEDGAAAHHESMGSNLARITLWVPTREDVYTLLLDALVSIDVWARRMWPFGSVYDGHIRYEAEPDGLEIWASTPALFARGFGDCEDLAADRAAQLITEGIPARAVLSLQLRTAIEDRWHVLVELPSGQLEDPSKALGMVD